MSTVSWSGKNYGLPHFLIVVPLYEAVVVGVAIVLLEELTASASRKFLSYTNHMFD
jgi:hypothetical protein